MPKHKSLYLVNRDPKELNDHVKVNFAEVLAEPDGGHSLDCVWSITFHCFKGYKDCCYKLLTLLCGLPLAILWGCEFAYVSLVHVWYVTPCIRIYVINCGCIQKFFGTCLHCFLQPMVEASSYYLSNIRVTNKQR